MIDTVAVQVRWHPDVPGDGTLVPSRESAKTCAGVATKVCLFGAPSGTGNLGVTALSYSILLALIQRQPDLLVTVFDYGRGLREHSLQSGKHCLRYQQSGAHPSRRVYRPESLWHMRACQCLFHGAGNPNVRRINEADAVLDVSGGDSFTDLYGPRRFGAMTLPKQIVLDSGRPLILLPQTYGPFNDPRNKARAARIVRSSAMAWARDARSFKALAELAGDGFDPERHRQGVDVAFLLPAQPVESSDDQTWSTWLNRRDHPLIGFNVSGLTYNQADDAAQRFGFQADYRALIAGFLQRVLNRTDCRILLIPHVISPSGHPESDVDACRAVREALGPSTRDRVSTVPALSDPRHVKWLIAQTDWFCGTRMHSTIAALSSGVPAAAIAYSPKTLGVFETCNQGEHVADPRTLDTDQMIERLWNSFQQRERASDSLRHALPCVLERAEQQMDEIAAVIQARGCSVAEGAMAS